MPAPLIQTAFTAGEIAPALWGQVDLRKYQTGVALGRNMIVDFRGGIYSRPGTSFVAAGLGTYTENPPCLVPFVFNTDQAYVLELSDSAAVGPEMRIIQAGAPVRQAALAIASVTAANPAVFTITASAYAVNDRVYIDGATGLLRANGTSAVNKRTFRVASAAGTAVTLADPITGVVLSGVGLTAYGASGTAAREVRVATPWAGADLFDLKFAQSADVMTVCHPDYPVYEIRRLSQTSWSVAAAAFGAALANPTNVSSLAVDNDSADPQLFYAYTVTAYNTRTGEESVPGDLLTTVVNRALDQGTGVVNQITWSVSSAANMYRIYKAQPVPLGFQGSPPYFWGLVGQAPGLSFVDANLQPDFAITPPTNSRPFTGGPITAISLTAPGFGYINPQILVTDPGGSGATFTIATTTAGAIDPPVVVATGGEGYSAPVLSIVENRALYTSGTGLTLAFSDTWDAVNPGSTYTPQAGSITVSVAGTGFHVPRINYTYSGGGTTGFDDGALYGLITTGGVVTGVVQDIAGIAYAAVAPSGGTMTFTIVDTAADIYAYSRATATATVTQATGNYPSTVAYFQQRRVYAATNNAPTTFWMSRPGEFENFNTSYPSLPADAIQATVVAGEQNAIVSMVAMTTGLIALTAGGAFLISGDGQGAPVTPATVNARAQTFSGAAPLQPIRIEDRVVYLHARKTSVRDLQYDFFANTYRGSDLSVLSPHLFNGRDIVQWAYASEPHKVLWAVRDDGVMLTLTYLKEQEVAGWSHSDTQGQYVSVCTIPEPGADAVYVAVRRLIDETYHYTIERFAEREFGQNVPQNIPSRPELAWCVDCGARSVLTYPAATLTTESASLQVLGNPVIVVPGTGYSASPVVTIIDAAGSGTGGAVSVTVTAGAITGATTTSVGQEYVAPQVVIEDATGQGAVVVVPSQDVYVFRTSAGILSSADEGKTLRVGGGVGTVATVTAADRMVVVMQQPVAGRLPNTPNVVLPPTFAGDWSMTEPATVFSGLDHLEGQMVQIVADGSVVAPQAVASGSIELEQPATLVLAGVGYTAQFQSLRPDAGVPTIQGRRKVVTSVILRLLDSRGAAVGNSWKAVYEQKQRNNEQYGQPISFQIGGGALSQTYTDAPIGQNPIGYEDAYTNVGGGWTTQGHVCILQSWPMPLHVLAYVSEIDMGDLPG